MAAAAVVAPGQAAAASDPIEIAAGLRVTFALYTEAGDVPQYATGEIVMDTPGVGVVIRRLQGLPVERRSCQVDGPCTVTAERPDISRFGVDVGIMADDGT